MNTLVTVAHVALIFAYTGLSILHYNVHLTDGVDVYSVLMYRVEIAWLIFGGF